MDEKKQQAFVLWCGQKLGVKSQDELNAALEKLGKEGVSKLYEQFNEEVWPELSQQIQSAKNGAKLDYISYLNGKCPEGYEVEKFLAGGKPCMRCKKMEAALKKTKGGVMADIKKEIKNKSKKKC